MRIMIEALYKMNFLGITLKIIIQQWQSMLKIISNIIRSRQQEFDNWYKAKLALANPCFYSSVDLRYSGKKLVPVDTNLFPAGFNNLDDKNIDKAAQLVQEYIKSYFPETKKILLIGEDHSRNLHYLDSLKTLEMIVAKAGFEIKIGAINAKEYNQYTGIKYSGIDIFPISKHNNILQIDGFIPELIILNNDLSSGLPDVLINIEQQIIPHPNNGWFMRRKSNHFRIYNELLAELEKLFSLPSFLLSTEFAICDGVNFKSKQGMDKLAEKVEQVLSAIKEKYKQHNISNKPYVVIKSDYGTYGMGVMMVRSADEVYALNKKLRNQMHITKSNIVNEQVIIQEGVKTIDKIGSASAEPLIYLINHQQVEFLYRIHQGKDEYSNLNSVGMEITSDHKISEEDYHYACNVIAKLATLAAALELSK